MRNFKRLILVIILMAIGSSVVVFVLENRSVAELRFLDFALPALPVSVYVLMAFCVGLFFGTLVGAFRFRLRQGKG